MPSDATTAGRPEADRILRSLLEVGANLSLVEDRRRLLDCILREARHLARAEAGSLYIVRDGALRFVAAQNDALPELQTAEAFLDRSLPVSRDSLAGYAAAQGRTINIPDVDRLPHDAPYRVNRAFDVATGYRTRSVVALPLVCPDGRAIGVLQLINHRPADGPVGPFPDPESSGIPALASMAAVTVHNALLREQVEQAQTDTIIRLSVAAELRDDETAAHIRRISRSSARIAAALGLPDAEVRLIRAASPMHDIGKLGIPDRILRKPGRLTPEERAVLETHTVIGAEIFENPSNDLMAMAREIALAHHERFDGGGYPAGLAGEAVPLPGRIVAIADVFDALLFKRCYKEAYPLEVALETIRCGRGSQFDPTVTDAFFASLDSLLYEAETATASPGAAAALV